MAQSVARSSARLPSCISPQLTQLVEVAPDGDQWLHEIKYDGYRMHGRIERGAAKLLTRTGLNWTHKYPAIAKSRGRARYVPSLFRRRIVRRRRRRHHLVQYRPARF